MKNRIGHRHVFGSLVPDFNSVVEPELASMRPEGVANQTARFALDATVLENIADAAERMMACGVESWIVGLATESFPGGLALLEQGVALLRERTGLPTYTPTHAVFAALKAIGATRIGIVTPFDEAANGNVQAAYEAEGFEVASIAGLARPGFDMIASTEDSETIDAFAQVASPRIETLVQVGTGLPMLHLVERLEKRFGVPVVASNQAAYWHALRSAGIADDVPGAGALLTTPSQR
ncbi:MAG: maleate isomerase [Myxococcota bacterium]|jgi:maleate isomerase